MGRLDEVDLTQKLPRKEQDKRLGAAKDRLEALRLQLAGLIGDGRLGPPVLVLFEGWDASGKGGTIQRITARLDPRAYVVHTIAAPAGEDKAHHYLYRFWRRLPPRGQIGIFDRSWYGRVLVERVEGYCTPEEWLRAYDEINQFEEELVEGAVVVCKFWLQISKEEQLKRFREREKTPFKRFKITPDDWRNRKRWRDYEQAAADMVERTSTDLVPWTLVEGEDKHYARVKVLRTICERLTRALDGS
jgi:polyphosphate kinase 2 (PPK2 family)